jgi:hypothetical protein
MPLSGYCCFRRLMRIGEEADIRSARQGGSMPVM